MTELKQKTTEGAKGALSQLPVDRLKSEALDFGGALGKKGLSSLSGKVLSLTDRLNDYAEGNATAKTALNVAEGDSPVKAGIKGVASKVKDTVSEKLGGGNSGSGHKIKVTNIVEAVDLPVPRDVAYEQWTLFEDFPSFMKKVENVKQEEDETVTWKAQIFLSHRTWKATIVDQVPNERIVWKSEGEKGHVDGAVTFHELAPDLTRVLVTLEYHPKGLFEHTGNLWRAQGRRARLELKHFRRFVANNTLINQDEVEGWTGEIHDEQVAEPGDEDQDETEDQTEDEDQPEDEDEGQDQDEDRDQDEEPDEDEGQEEERRRRPAARKSAKKAPARKSAAKKAPAKKAAAKKSAAKKAPAKKATARKASAEKPTAKKAPAKKSTAKKAPAKKAPAKKSAAKRAPSKRTAAARSSSSGSSSSSTSTSSSTATRPAARKAPAKKSAAKKTTAKKATAKKTSGGSRSGS